MSGAPIGMNRNVLLLGLIIIIIIIITLPLIKPISGKGVLVSMICHLTCRIITSNFSALNRDAVEWQRAGEGGVRDFTKHWGARDGITSKCWRAGVQNSVGLVHNLLCPSYCTSHKL